MLELLSSPRCAEISAVCLVRVWDNRKQEKLRNVKV